MEVGLGRLKEPSLMSSWGCNWIQPQASWNLPDQNVAHQRLDRRGPDGHHRPAADLDRLFLAKDLLDRTLVYVRYHARGIGTL